MDQSKLKKIIDEKNERREEDVLRDAARVIEQIAKYQQDIKELNERIVELRKELAALEVERLDPSTILG